MKKFFCYGKKDFCTSFECDKGVVCAHYDGSGGEDRDAPMTNADQIRSMTDEELADFLNQWGTSTGAWQKDPGETLYWLQQPAGEEDKHETD